MSSIRYSPDVLPAEGDDAVAFIAGKVRASADVQAGLLQPGGEEQGVYEGSRPAAHPERFVIVRELQQTGGRIERLSGLDRVPVQVVTSCQADLGHKRRWHRVMHRKIRAALEGETFEPGDIPEAVARGLGVSRSLRPVKRKHKPVSIGYEKETGQAEQVAQYDVIIAPTDTHPA